MSNLIAAVGPIDTLFHYAVSHALVTVALLAAASFLADSRGRSSYRV